MNKGISAIVKSARELADEIDKLSFGFPVSVTYNVLRYAWEGHLAYLQQFGVGPKSVLFVGMNPGPWGMVQTGIPFGEVSVVRDWMKIQAVIGKPNPEHPKRPVKGFACERSEVSGRRLWGLFAERFGAPENFFNEHFVINYCPLAFMDESGRNLTPDKLPATATTELQNACDRNLQKVVNAISPEWVIGIGVYGEGRARNALGERLRYGRILHPSPANPSANKGWANTATDQLVRLGVWK